MSLIIDNKIWQRRFNEKIYRNWCFNKLYKGRKIKDVRQINKNNKEEYSCGNLTIKKSLNDSQEHAKNIDARVELSFVLPHTRNNLKENFLNDSYWGISRSIITCLNQFSVSRVEVGHDLHKKQSRESNVEVERRKKRLNHRSYSHFHFHTRLTVILLPPCRRAPRVISSWEYQEFNAANLSQVIRSIHFFI